MQYVNGVTVIMILQYYKQRKHGKGSQINRVFLESINMYIVSYTNTFPQLTCPRFRTVFFHIMSSQFNENTSSVYVSVQICGLGLIYSGKMLIAELDPVVLNRKSQPGRYWNQTVTI